MRLAFWGPLCESGEVESRVFEWSVDGVGSLRDGRVARVVICRQASRCAGNGVKAGDLAPDLPDEGEVGDKHGGAAFAHIPEAPHASEGLGEGVDFVEDSG